jgi:23S rRNA A2030 N6-methylase RlmJ
MSKNDFRATKFEKVEASELCKMANLFVLRDSNACKTRYGARIAEAHKAHDDRVREINARHKLALAEALAAYEDAVRGVPDDVTAKKRYAMALVEANALRDAEIIKSADLHDSDVIRAWREFHDSPLWTKES